MENKQPKMGRPKTEEYRKKTMRFSRIEDTFQNILDRMESSADRKLILQTLEKLKA